MMQPLNSPIRCSTQYSSQLAAALYPLPSRSHVAPWTLPGTYGCSPVPVRTYSTQQCTMPCKPPCPSQSTSNLAISLPHPSSHATLPILPDRSLQLSSYLHLHWPSPTLVKMASQLPLDSSRRNPTIL
ncbi:hypothetical protein HDV62DRAFT_240627 [Trichoderma sp. SZMC 28011]